MDPVTVGELTGIDVTPDVVQAERKRSITSTVHPAFLIYTPWIINEGSRREATFYWFLDLG